MLRFARLILAVAMFAGLATVSAPASAEVSAADRSAMQALVEGQIDAFRRDDGAAAYAYASPPIQMLYPTVDGFMAMVKQGFQPVYRPQQYTFGPMIEGPSGPILRVFVTGPDGNPYVAEYAFQRQPDGSWKINGCQLIKNIGPTI